MTASCTNCGAIYPYHRPGCRYGVCPGCMMEPGHCLCGSPRGVKLEREWRSRIIHEEYANLPATKPADNAGRSKLRPMRRPIRQPQPPKPPAWRSVADVLAFTALLMAIILTIGWFIRGARLW